MCRISLVVVFYSLVFFWRAKPGLGSVRKRTGKKETEFQGISDGVVDFSLDSCCSPMTLRAVNEP
jgi:hypothetical protein